MSKEFTPVWSDAVPAEIALAVPRVANVKELTPGQGFYIGRAMPGVEASTWANTHKLAKDTPEARTVAVRAYLEDVLERPDRCDLGTLSGLTLTCWCSPKLCHGNGLAALVGLTRFYGSACPHCAGPVRSWLNWHKGLHRLAEAWVCQDFRACGRRGEAIRTPPDLLVEAPAGAVQGLLL